MKKDITDLEGKIIGYWCCREAHRPEDLLPNLPPERYPDYLLDIWNDVKNKITKFPAVCLEHFQIFDEGNWGKGHGRRAMHDFLKYASDLDYRFALVQIGHFGTGGIKNSTGFYTSLGWKQFVSPTPLSLRFAYFDLADYRPVP